jgi:hypothetical protein
VTTATTAFRAAPSLSDFIFNSWPAPQIDALRTAGNAEARYRAKWLLVRGLYDLGYNAKRIREVFRLVDWMMHLRQDLEARFGVELKEFEELRKMPYVTSIERLAEARGEVLGRSSLVLKLLAKICGGVTDVHRAQVGRLTADELDQLAEDLLAFQSIADLEAWLDQRPRTN